MTVIHLRKKEGNKDEDKREEEKRRSEHINSV